MMEEEKKTKKNNRPAGIPKRNKQSYAQYVWVRQLYNEMDRLKERIDKLEARVSDISVVTAYDIAELKKTVSLFLDEWKKVKDENHQTQP